MTLNTSIGWGLGTCVHQRSPVPSLIRPYNLKQPWHRYVSETASKPVNTFGHYQHSQRRRHVQVQASAIAVAGDSFGQPEYTKEFKVSWQRDLFKRMMSFMGPAACIPLADPLMSLVDTVCIGQFAGTSELAAVGPANVVFVFAQYVFQSLGMATLSLVSRNMREQKNEVAEQVLTSALVLAAGCGVLTTIGLELFSEQIIRATGVKDMSLVPLACHYLSIRALAQPAVLVTNVCQSGLLAQRDSLTPMLSVLVSSTVSLLGNLLFVRQLGWGLGGAAMTTVATQWVGAGVMLWALQAGKSKVKASAKLPTLQHIVSLIQTMGPLSLTYLCKNLCYVLIQTTAATLHTVSLAAHQVVFSLWNLAAFSVYPVEQTTIAFQPLAKNKWERLATAELMVSMGILVALSGGVVVSGLLCFSPQAFASDPAVWSILATTVQPVLASMFFSGIDIACTAVNLSAQDFGYAARSYIITLSVVAAYYLQNHQWTLPGVWWGIVLFFGVRSIQSLSRMVWREGWLSANSGMRVETSGTASLAPVAATAAPEATATPAAAASSKESADGSQVSATEAATSHHLTEASAVPAAVEPGQPHSVLNGNEGKSTPAAARAPVSITS